MGKRFDSILGTIGNTPVLRINKLGPEGINLYVKMESFTGSMGKVTVASGTTKEGTEFLHGLATTMKEAGAVMPQAFAEMMKSAKPTTATTNK